MLSALPAVLAQQPTVASHIAVNASREAQELLARRITIRLNGVSLERAIDSVSRVAKVFVQYQTPILAAYTRSVSVHMTDVSLGIVLERVLDGTALQVAPGAHGFLTIVVTPGSATDSIPHMSSVSGRIVDSTTGRGLAGATVKVAGTKLSAISGDSGTFTLSHVPSGTQVITVRLFGYRPVERTMDVSDSGRTSVRIRMSAVPTVLSGMVTTATGQQRKIEVGNDITTINVDSVIRIAPINSLTDLLETRVPGLTVQHSSGIPGAPSRLRLRGVGSPILNNDPIVIVDGVRVYASQSDARNRNLAAGAGTRGIAEQGNVQYVLSATSPLDQIDPNQIETLEVFKGPSASALYGSDAANGVIVITTKRGRAGPTHWTFAAGQGVNWLPGNWPVNYFRFGHGTYLAGVGPYCTWDDLACTTDSIVPVQALNDPQTSLFTHGSNQTANLTVSGGTTAMQYSLTGSTTADGANLKMPEIEAQRYQKFYGSVPDALLRPARYTTWGVSGTLTALPIPAVRVALQSSLFNSTQHQSSLEGAIAQLQAEYVDRTQLQSTFLIQDDVLQSTAGTLTANDGLTLSWQSVGWLPLTATAGLATVQRTDEAYVPYGVNYAGPGTVDADTTGEYSIGRGTSQNQTLNAGTSIPLTHFLTLSVGGNVYSQSTADFRVQSQLLSPGVRVPTSFRLQDGSPSQSSQSTTNASTYGWYLQPQLKVASRFFIAPGFRLDGGSGGSASAGSVGGLSAFPKMDFSWIAVDRQGERPLGGVLTLLRPRVAFGLAGTQPNPQNRLRLFNSAVGTTTIQLNDSTTVQTVILNSLGNTQLRPERSRELEGGFDATLWNGRLSLTYSQYNKTRLDAILDIPVAPSVSGGQSLSSTYSLPLFVGSTVRRNIGTVRNTGTEMTLNATLVQRRAVTWNVGANFSDDDNKVVSLLPGQPAIIVNGGAEMQERVTPGYPLFGLWAQPILAFADANHDGKIESNEIQVGDSAVYVGQSVPKYQLNFTSDLSLLNGRLSVHTTVAYENGLTQVNSGGCGNGLALNLLPNAPQSSLASQAALVAAGCRSGGGVGYNNYTFIGLAQTVNTLRFNELSINYDVPPGVARWLRVPRMMVALQGSNLGLRTNYRGKDPDVNAFSTTTGGDFTTDAGQIPEPRTWWFKVTLGD